MKNFSPTNNERRYTAYVGSLNTTQLHKQNPYIVAWWSAAMPGFGHILLSKHLRGIILFAWEIIINVMSKLNLAMVYSFNGEMDMAKQVIEPKWILMYIPVYIFTIWDSYRSTVDMNKQFLLAETENAPFPTFSINALEINHLEQKIPFMATLWSLLTPGLGQLYIHRVMLAFICILWFIIFVIFSDVLIAIHHLFLGQINEATDVLDPQWFMFFPSLIFFSMYDAYVHAVENNKLYKHVQRNVLKEDYQATHVHFPRPEGGG
ncbi:hypothetical protein HUG15_21795 [Salicibibacter cibarius]|uniref:Uncharacterized protein n=1 Tax=Salicibibacter cibarius TaxID=2743000 RepID=A0A7T6Z7S8_9BACI|nr:hypothetical protein [Salicibibacter cibarius]QQK77951.1 hypothetical protein HUG15_21795 [Salicibibacter cibarius]